METRIEYQWQAKRGDTWANDGKLTKSYRRALRYIDVASRCVDCQGHRLTMTIYVGETRAERIRLLYTLNSRPKD